MIKNHLLSETRTVLHKIDAIWCSLPPPPPPPPLPASTTKTKQRSRQELEADAVDARKRASSAKQAEEEYLAAAAARGDLRSGEGFNSQYMVHMRALEAGMDAYGLSDADKASNLTLNPKL